MAIKISDNTIEQDGVPAITFDAQGIQKGLSAAAATMFSGLELSNSSGDPANDIDIAPGGCRDKANTRFLELASTMTKQLDAVWTAGTNQGGLFSGTMTANTWYHVFLIRKDSDGTTDVGFSTDINAVDRPAGWTSYKWIGAVLTDVIPAILKFMQVGDWYLWDSPVTDVSTSTPSTGSRTLYTMTVPPVDGLSIDVRIVLSPNASPQYLIATNESQSDVGATAGNSTVVAYDDASGYYDKANAVIKGITNQKLGIRTVYQTTVIVGTVGWQVDRGLV